MARDDGWTALNSIPRHRRPVTGAFDEWCSEHDLDAAELHLEALEEQRQTGQPSALDEPARRTVPVHVREEDAACLADAGFIVG